jgi:serine protease Do
MGKAVGAPELQPASLKPTANRPSGISVLDVTSGSPASKGGLKAGDVIVAVDNVPVTNSHELYDEISFKSPGQTIAMSVMRNDKPISVKVTTEAAPEEVAAVRPSVTPSHGGPETTYGFSVQDLTKDLANQFNLTTYSGVVITAVAPRSPAYLKNIVAGDIITILNGKKVTNTKDFLKALDAVKPGDDWTMWVAVRGKEDPSFIRLTAPDQ